MGFQLNDHKTQQEYTFTHCHFLVFLNIHKNTTKQLAQKLLLAAITSTFGHIR